MQKEKRGEKEKASLFGAFPFSNYIVKLSQLSNSIACIPHLPPVLWSRKTPCDQPQNKEFHLLHATKTERIQRRIAI